MKSPRCPRCDSEVYLTDDTINIATWSGGSVLWHKYKCPECWYEYFTGRECEVGLTFDEALQERKRLQEEEIAAREIATGQYVFSVLQSIPDSEKEVLWKNQSVSTNLWKSMVCYYARNAGQNLMALFTMLFKRSQINMNEQSKKLNKKIGQKG